MNRVKRIVGLVAVALGSLFLMGGVVLVFHVGPQAKLDRLAAAVAILAGAGAAGLVFGLRLMWRPRVEPTPAAPAHMKRIAVVLMASGTLSLVQGAMMTGFLSWILLSGGVVALSYAGIVWIYIRKRPISSPPP